MSTPPPAPSNRAPTDPIGPPVPAVRPAQVGAHGDSRLDDYYWLRDRESPEVIAHLEAENAYTAACTAHLGELGEALFDEMVARIQETDLSVPVRKGDWLYYSRTHEGNQYADQCRRPATGGPSDFEIGQSPGERVVLDQNALAEGHEFFAVGNFNVSPDHARLAYSVDTNGSERYTMRIRDLDTGVDGDESMADTYYGSAWSKDSTVLFYTRTDDAMRPFQLWRHRVGTPAADDACVYTEEDESFYLGVANTKDEAYVVLTLESKVTTEVHVLDSTDPSGPFKVIEPRRGGIEYSVDHHAGRFLIVTNDGALDFRLMATPVPSPGRVNWTELIPPEPGVRLEGIEVFGSHLALAERAGGSARIRILELASGAISEVAQPSDVGTPALGGNAEFATSTVRYEYTSMVTPRSVYDYDMASGQARLLKRQPVLGPFDPDAYTTERLWAPASQGHASQGHADVDIPITVVYRNDRAGAFGHPENAPLLLYGYGSYEASMDPYFSSLRLSLLDRGFVFATAHIRGGGEMGRSWYEEGKIGHKTNTFDDFVAAARHLIDTGWTTPDRLVARGGSAGGLLMGAVANRAPELFRAIVAEVPFVDCLTTILDESLPLTVTEWEEWGNPVADPDIYDYIKSYSPYDNVEAHPYPLILATAGLNDPRVAYWEPAKWVAKLRLADPSNTVLLKTEMGAGHGGPSGRYDAWKDEAFVYSFILDAVGQA
ncbi:MAG: S9 family peptidase [Acidimicrobiales bacterium]